MPRKARIDAPGALHHIIVRGINQRKIFFDDSDRDDFFDRLGAILSESKTPCFAWAFMTKHLHLLLRTGVAPIASVMRRLLTGYWGTRELEMSAVEISKKLNIASSLASESAARGRQIVEQQGLKLLDEEAYLLGLLR
jgi:REP element-mobilizing transposase RayT